MRNVTCDTKKKKKNSRLMYISDYREIQKLQKLIKSLLIVILVGAMFSDNLDYSLSIR